MSAVLDYLNLCRLCLVKDKVNIAIFDETSDVRQLFLKISACLPVKVAQDDRLPKKICDSCLYKVDLLYQFWNTTISSEKQLLQWCGGGSGGEGVSIKGSDDTLMLPQSHAHPHSIHTETIILKEERLDSADTKLVDDEYGPDMSTPTATVSANDLYSEEFALSYQQQQQLTEATSNYTSSAPNQAQKKRPRGRPPGSTKKKRQSTRTKARRDSVDDSDDDRPLAAVISEPEDHLNSAAGLQITKVEKEAESDEDYVDNSESLEPTTFVAVPSTSACELPGPSGIVAKGTTSTSTEPGLFYTKSLDSSDKLLENLPEPKITIEQELMHLLSAEGDCSELLQNLTASEHFDKLLLDEQQHGKYELDHIISEQLAAATGDTAGCYNVIQEDLVTVEQHCTTLPTTATTETAEVVQPTGSLQCNICDKTFRNLHKLRTHKRCHEAPMFECEICARKFSQKSHLTVHRRRHLSEYVAVCASCNRGFYTKAEHRNHVAVAHKQHTHMCEVCGHGLSTRSALRDHQRTHEPRTRSECCEVCGKTFLNGRNLRNHLKTHAPPSSRDHCCQICGKVVSDRRTLEVHVRTHTGHKPLQCAVCDKTFASAASMRVHMRTHSGAKPYTCTECGKAFSQRSTLTIHVRYHTGERPYTCTTCGKCFVSRTHLNGHTKTHQLLSQQPFI